MTKLGRLVRDGKIRTLEEIYLYSLPIKEFEIIDFFLSRSLKDEVLKIMPVQKQTRAGQRTRFKAFVAIGDSNGHIGLGVKCSKEVATAIRGAIILAKLSVVPVRRGYWGNKIGKPHTVPCKVSIFKCQSPIDSLFFMMRKLSNLCGFHGRWLHTTGMTSLASDSVKQSARVNHPLVPHSNHVFPTLLSPPSRSSASAVPFWSV